MPTQEERLSALEKFQKVALERNMESRFETLESRFGTLESRFGTLESRFGTLESRFEAQDKKLDQMLHLLTTLTAKPGQET